MVLDSVAGNFRAEYGGGGGGARGWARRSGELVRLGGTLRACARKYGCAVVVANQVGDRFGPVSCAGAGGWSSLGLGTGKGKVAAIAGTTTTTTTTPSGSEGAEAEAVGRGVGRMGGRGEGGRKLGEVDALLSLDHQQRFFTGWGAGPDEVVGLKTPSLGLVWSQQIACRVALVKEAAYGSGGEGGGLESAEGSGERWRRWMRVAFAGWVGGAEGEKGVEFEVWEGGVRAVGEGKGVREEEEEG